MRILYIDDELDILEIVKGFFEDENLSVETCSNIDTAVDLVKNHHFDVIISDANMPSGSGFELFRILKEELNFKGKLIIATGDLQKIGSKEEQRYDHVIYKPIDFNELISLVKSFNREARGLSDNDLNP